LFPQKILSVQFLLLLDFAAYQKKIVISFCYCPKYVSRIKKRKTKRKEKIVQRDVYWFLLDRTKQGKIGSNQLGISSNLIKDSFPTSMWQLVLGIF
jgi:hypothetical protein